jgi:hypothetical protein
MNTTNELVGRVDGRSGKSVWKYGLHLAFALLWCFGWTFGWALLAGSR